MLRNHIGQSPGGKDNEPRRGSAKWVFMWSKNGHLLHLTGVTILARKGVARLGYIPEPQGLLKNSITVFENLIVAKFVLKVIRH